MSRLSITDDFKVNRDLKKKSEGKANATFKVDNIFIIISNVQNRSKIYSKNYAKFSYL
jgi:hypothetical protein